MKAVLAAPFILLAACATIASEADGPRIEGEGFCKAEGLTDLVGRQATSELGADALRRSDSLRLRWIRPGDAVTMDYRQDRLNVNLDHRGRVDSFSCG